MDSDDRQAVLVETLHRGKTLTKWLFIAAPFAATSPSAITSFAMYPSPTGAIPGQPDTGLTRVSIRLS